MGKTLGFYQNFGFDLQRLGDALRCVQGNPSVNQADLASCMGVNQPVAEGFFGWLRHTGLIVAKPSDNRGRVVSEVTPFGSLASVHDPTLTDLGTQWILHYYLCTEHVERSDAWKVLINQFLSPGVPFTSEEFCSYFASVMGGQAKNRSALNKDPLVALSTYVRPQALGRIGLLTKDKSNYRVGSPHLPSILVIGFLLLDWWQAIYSQNNTLRFSQLCQEDGSVGRVCQIDAPQVKRIVGELTGFGYLSFSETQHEPVNRLFHEPPESLLEKYYGQR